MNLIVRPQFLADAQECAEYLTTEAGGAVTITWLDALKKVLDQIQQTPEIGRLRQDLPVEGIRSLNLRKYPNYLVFYRLENDAIELLRVRHGMMNLAELFSD